MSNIIKVIKALKILKKYTGNNDAPLYATEKGDLIVQVNTSVSDKDEKKLRKLGWENKKEDTKIWFW